MFQPNKRFERDVGHQASASTFFVGEHEWNVVVKVSKLSSGNNLNMIDG